MTKTFCMYRNDPKFSDRYAWANSTDPDQTAPRGAVWSGSTLFAIPPFRLHRLDTLLYGRATDYNKFLGCPNI